VGELLQDLRPQAATRRGLLADQQVDARQAFPGPTTSSDSGWPATRYVWIVPTGRPWGHDQEVLGRVAFGEGVLGVAETLLRVAPPAAHVLAAEPVPQERQMLRK
jgi:hypothetical protein